MSLLSSIDTSLFTTPYSAAQELSPFQPVKAVDYAKQDTPNVAAEDFETPKVDLNNYYSNLQHSESENYDLESSLSQLSQNFSYAVTSAVANGMRPQDAVNIQKAKAAYTAMANIIDYSTFEIEI